MSREAIKEERKLKGGRGGKMMMVTKIIKKKEIKSIFLLT